MIYKEICFLIFDIFLFNFFEDIGESVRNFCLKCMNFYTSKKHSEFVVGNVTAYPSDKVIIPIEVIPRDGSLFNDNVTVELPDGTKKVVEIVNGKGSVEWTIPMYYKGDYIVKVSSDDTGAYYPANGTGVITVIVEEHPQNGTVTPQKGMLKDTLVRHETGNPILALLAVLTLLGISVKRKK